LTSDHQEGHAAPVVLALPFRGRWLAQMSPARRVPSHGTHLFATTYAIDFVAVRGRRTANAVDWRTVLSVEPPERFVGYGQPILAPASGRVAAVHDGEPDHGARRSPLALFPYALTQASRVRQGPAAIAGNHVILELDGGAYVLLAHLRAGSLRVAAGDRVVTGQELGACGNSGNSTQPHVHIQAMDSVDPYRARGVPLAFRSYQTWPRGAVQARRVEQGLPDNGDVVERIDE
jgi:murein DD-endopeptidase MepM/ murein hydrolase activator NlpD